jgi:hypothetical protein
MFLLAEVPLVGLFVAPERTGTLVARVNAWAAAHGRELAVLISGSLGAFLIVRGLVNA